VIHLDLPWGCTVTSHSDTSHTSYSKQVFFKHILSVSAPATLATGHKDATPT
jgi:hypothetical protein